jgi:hypothetical protein
VTYIPGKTVGSVGAEQRPDGFERTRIDAKFRWKHALMQPLEMLGEELRLTASDSHAFEKRHAVAKAAVAQRQAGTRGERGSVPGPGREVGRAEDCNAIV